MTGLGLDEVPEYDLDSEDEEWLNAQTNERVSPMSFYPSSPVYWLPSVDVVAHLCAPAFLCLHFLLAIVSNPF